MKILRKKYDPLKEFAGADEARLDEACGLIPYFVSNDDAPIVENLEAGYGFGSLFEMKGGSVDRVGVYRYPGDPALYPLMEIEKGDEKLFIYDYAIVAVLGNNGEAFISRMD